MPDEAIKKRLARAKKKAIGHFEEIGYRIIESNNKPFCFIATRRQEARFVCVVVDQITERDIIMTQEHELPGPCTREIFCQKNDRFEIREVRE